MSNIEDDMKVMKEFVDVDRKIRQKEVESDYDKFCEKICIAIENVLSEREQDKSRIKELEENNRMLALEGSRVRLDLYIKQNYIPKQKVKEILDKAEVMDYYTLPDVIRDLEKLLEAEDE